MDYLVDLMGFIGRCMIVSTMVYLIVGMYRVNKKAQKIDRKIKEFCN